MTSAEKLLAKMQGLPADMPLNEVERVLKHLGWSFARRRGSHHMFQRDGHTISEAQKSGQVKRIYLQQILDRER